MASFRVQIDQRELAAAVAQLSDRVSDPAPAMRSISLVLMTGLEEAFQRQASPATGTPWERLSEATIAGREKKGYWPGKILQRTGRLASSLTADYGRDFAAAGSNVVYAALLNFGAEAGEFGATSRGQPIPFGDIPARPFAELSPAVAEDVLDVIYVHLAGQT